MPGSTDTATSSWDGALARAAADVIEAANSLGSSRWASITRAWCVPFLFHGMETVFASGDDPHPKLEDRLHLLASYLETAAKSGMTEVATQADMRDQASSIEFMTGEHYGRLFREFDAASFAAEPKRLLHDRLSRNNVALPELGMARVLDAGCGGGRYSVAWHLLGAREVLGVDLSEPGLADARARVEAMKVEGVSFQRADVVELPLETDRYDIVFSNGVLHHTRDWRTGVRHLVRVLKPGGLGWLYLIENPGGLFWDVIELGREIMKDERHEDARIAVAALGIPANRVFYMLDHVMAPINLRLTEEQITSELRAAGASGIRRLARGADFDRVERIHQNDAYARVKYGAGEHRFVFSK